MKTIAKPYQSTIDIKKSKFICRLYPAQNEMEAKEIISKISEEFKDATHNCSAYLVSDGEGYDGRRIICRTLLQLLQDILEVSN